MFKDSATARTYLRAAVAASLAMLSVAATIWIDNVYVKLASAGLAVLGGYLGIGAASGSVEPFYGNKSESVSIPGVLRSIPRKPGEDIRVRPT